LAGKDPEGSDRAARMRTLLQEMLGYVTVSTCRQLAILDYFSDEAERALGPCGLCDRCAAPVRPVSRETSCDDAASALAVLATVAWCGGRFGVSRIVEILRGSRSKALLACGGEECQTYGSCRALSKPSVTSLVKGLIESGYLQVEGAEYPTIDLTGKGQEALQGTNAVIVTVAEVWPGETPVKKLPREKASVGALPAGPVDPDIFERLRKLRTELAEEENVAPFVIFHDKTLKAIASHKPATTAALLDVPGIGEQKAERYGRRVLAVVNGE
ncbi:MAG: HRDC domain-containing protein, partial [Nitrospira sp.]|nr:HRDC domain-containing protein [Nitrospira sp.]